MRISLDMLGSLDMLISFGIFISPVFIFGWITWFSPRLQLGASDLHGHYRNRLTSMATTTGSSVALMAIFTGDAPSEKPPSFRYTVMVRGDPQT
jgi:hypothetical protein